MTDWQAVEVKTFDPVNTPIEAMDLTNPLMMHGTVRCLQDEVLYWRENAACYLSTALMYAGKPDDLASWLWQMSPARVLKEHVATLGAALDGQVHTACVACSGDIRPGDMVVSYEDEGEAHALCSGASAEEMAAGRMAIPPDAISTEGMEPDEAEAARADPFVTIFPSAQLFTPAQIGAYVDEGRAMLKALEALDAERETRISDNFAASQDDVGARYGLTPSTDKASISTCRAWFTDIGDARDYAAGQALVVWDLVKGELAPPADAA